MHEIAQVRMWAALYAASYLCLPLALVGGPFPAAVGLVVLASWLRFLHSAVAAPVVRRLKPRALLLACATGPVGALWLRRRLRKDLPVVTLRPRPRF